MNGRGKVVGVVAAIALMAACGGTPFPSQDLGVGAPKVRVDATHLAATLRATSAARTARLAMNAELTGLGPASSLTETGEGVLDLANTLEGDVATGARIVARSLEEPLKQIAVNAGLEGGVIVEKVKNLKGANGLNAQTGEYEDLVKAGVIDAAKVTRSALQNAASIAALFLTTEAVIADKPEEKGAPAMPGGGMEDF